ncbi:hypothetical protein L208DRAFT_597878 [Tricholoma matsutake]|nr:hypothetical protein L208DRAFT_597878 [Tricholoma matsutake 945]
MPRNGLKFFLSGRNFWDQAFWGVVGGPHHTRTHHTCDQNTVGIPAPVIYPDHYVDHAHKFISLA